jgi:hypothetical protein
VTEAFVARVRDGGEGSGISAIASLWHIVKMGNGQNRGRAAKRVSGSPLKPARQGNESDRRPNQRAPTESKATEPMRRGQTRLQMAYIYQRASEHSPIPSAPARC